MMLKNKTNLFQNIDGVIFRPWRVEKVSDNVKFDEDVFEIVKEVTSNVTIKHKN